jgi:hypothetical protein
MLGIGFVFFDASFGAKLLKGKPATNESEAPITLMATLYAGRSRLSGEFRKTFLHLSAIGCGVHA